MIKKIICIGLIISLSACGISTEYVRPELDVASDWAGGEATQTSQADREWWEQFNDDRLNELMRHAQSNNPSIKAGIHVIEQSRAALTVAGADLWPEVNGSLSGAKSYNNPVDAGHEVNNKYSAGISASYELDILGSNRAKQDIAEANLVY